MRRNHRIICFIILLMAGFGSHRAWAENCNSTVSGMTINTQNVKYLPTLPVNSQMSQSMADNGSGIRFSCDLQVPLASVKRIVYQQLNTTGAAVAVNGVHIFASNLDGLGYSLGFQCGGGAVHYIDGNNAPMGAESAVICDSDNLPAMLGQREITVKAYVTFYKTGDVHMTSGNHANVGSQSQVGQLILQQTTAGQGTTNSTPTVLDLAALNVDIGSSGSCMVTSTSINVPLGSVNKSAFKGVNTTGGTAQSFAIPVYCSQPTDVRIGFFGMEVGQGFPNTLALTRGSNSASGVGVKLTYGNNGASAPSAGSEVTLNDTSNLPVLKHVSASSAASAERIYFNAQYVQTEGTVGPGTANSMATFTLVYN